MHSGTKRKRDEKTRESKQNWHSWKAKSRALKTKRLSRKRKSSAKEKECQMLADVVRDLSALGSRYRASDSDSSESDESGEEDDVYEDEDEESAGPK